MIKRVGIIVGILTGTAFAALLIIMHHYRGEQYQIVHAVFLTTNTQGLLQQPAALCYSNEQLAEAVKTTNLLDQVGMGSIDLDHTHLIACVVSGYTVEKVVGRQNFGLVILHKSPQPGVSFTVFRGTKRFLQFHYPEH